MISSFDQLQAHVRAIDPISVAVAGGNDTTVLESLEWAIDRGMVRNAVIVGDPEFIAAHSGGPLQAAIEIIPAYDPESCGAKAVQAVRQNKAGALIKGSIDSKSFLKAIINRETGICAGALLSNITLAEMPSVEGFLAATDNGIIPNPDLDQKKQIILNTRFLFRGLEYSSVKVAAIAATEKVSDKLSATTDAAALTALSVKGELPGFVVDGPFGYDVAISRDAASKKGLADSPVAGQADLILFPTIDAANAVAKSWKYHGAAKTGSIVLGASAPVLLNSRSDSASRRVNALMLAIAEARGRTSS